MNKHPLENSLCLLYVKLLGGDEYILPFNHSEAINLDISYLDKLNSDNKKYIYDKKQFNHIVKLKNVIDINLVYYMNNNEPLDIDDITTNSHDYFNRKYYKMKDINTVIPILKHLENIEAEMLEEFEIQWKSYLDSLPTKLSLPLLFLFFPSYVILIFGPLIITFLQGVNS